MKTEKDIESDHKLKKIREGLKKITEKIKQDIADECGFKCSTCRIKESCTIK